MTDKVSGLWMGTTFITHTGEFMSAAANLPTLEQGTQNLRQKLLQSWFTEVYGELGYNIQYTK